MNIEQWPIDRPKPYEKNARKIPQSAIDKVAVSLKEFGWQQPIVVDKAGVVVAGHTRLSSAKKLGQSNLNGAPKEGHRRDRQSGVWRRARTDTGSLNR